MQFACHLASVDCAQVVSWFAQVLQKATHSDRQTAGAKASDCSHTVDVVTSSPRESNFDQGSDDKMETDIITDQRLPAALSSATTTATSSSSSLSSTSSSCSSSSSAQMPQPQTSEISAPLSTQSSASTNPTTTTATTTATIAPPGATATPAQVVSTYSSPTKMTNPLRETQTTNDETSTAIATNNEQTKVKKSVLFDTVTVYHFNRSQGFNSIPSQGGSTLGMKRRHFLRRRLSVDLYEEVRRRSRREILLKIKLDKTRRNVALRRTTTTQQEPSCEQAVKDCNSASSSASTSSSTSSTNATTSDSDDESFTDISDISDSELESDSYIFLQPIGVKLRRSLLRASGVGRIDPKEKRDCKTIRDSRSRTGCSCVNQCIPELCECSLLGVNCHVDRISFPCGCVEAGCRNPEGRTEFDSERVKEHLFDTLLKSGIG